MDVLRRMEKLHNTQLSAALINITEPKIFIYTVKNMTIFLLGYSTALINK